MIPFFRNLALVFFVLAGVAAWSFDSALKKDGDVAKGMFGSAMVILLILGILSLLAAYGIIGRQ